MSKLKTAGFLLLTILVVAQSITIYFMYSELQNDSAEEPVEVIDTAEEKVKYLENIANNPQLSERENLDAIEKQPKAVEDLFVTGWIPDWDMSGGLASLQRFDETFSGVSPVFFFVNEDGSLKETAGTNNQAVMEYARNNGLEMIPTITLFDTEIMSSVLNDPVKMQRHIDEIETQVVDNNYDGIDLDYESIYLKDKELFFDLLEEVSLRMAKLDKKFIFTVLPKWGDDVIYETLPQTRQTQDYRRIAELVDEFRIMTYEYTGRTSEVYGPIAPLAWMEDTIRYAIMRGVPREKLVLGIHTYNYNYSARAKMDTLEYYPFYDPKGTEDLPSALANFGTRIDELSMTIEFNEEWGEAVGTYQSEGETRYVVFPNDKSIGLRKQLAADYGIKGIAYWKIGGEGSLEL